jgi:predicted Zn-dependent protease
MKAATLVLSALFLVSAAAPARAQFGALGKIKNAADKAADAKQKYDDWNITDKEERAIGEDVSLKLRSRFGVYQDEKVTKYVSLVGGVLAQASSRPNLDWKFIVLDTDGVNAYAAPGGIVHITRGLLGLIKNESELAGILGHEITHVVDKHTVKAIQKSKEIGMTADAAGGGSARNDFIASLAGKAYQKLFSGEWSRSDENDADKNGIILANKVGYDPHGLANALQKVSDRNAGSEEPNGIFASHPVIKDRIESVNKEIGAQKLSAKAVDADRYKQNITFDAKAIGDITMDVSGAAGLAAGNKKTDDKDAKKEDKPKKGFGLSSITGGGKQAQSNQQIASAGARGGVPDRDAKGGSNPSALNVKVSAAEIDAFKKGIAS